MPPFPPGTLLALATLRCRQGYFPPDKPFPFPFPREKVVRQPRIYTKCRFDVVVGHHVIIVANGQEIWTLGNWVRSTNCKEFLSATVQTRLLR